jgi:MFS transporter, PPP family, 3-phenylpropionic acid transporter
MRRVWARRSRASLPAVLLGGLYFAFYGSSAAWWPVFSIYLQQAGLSGVQIGLLFGARPAVVVLSQPLWGVIADLWGHRRTLLVGLALSSLLILGFGWQAGFWFLMAWTILYTVLSNPAGSLIDSLVLDHVEGTGEASYGQFRLWGAVGWAAGAFVVGQVITGRDIRLTFVFAAVIMLAGWGLALRIPHGLGASARAGSRWHDVLAVLRNRTLLILLALLTGVQVGAVALNTFFPILMEGIGASRAQIGTAIAMQGLGELPLYLGAAAIIRRIGPKWALITSFLVMAGRSFLYGTLQQPGALMAVQLVHGLSFSLGLVAAVEYVNRLVPARWRATGQSLYSAAYFGLGAILGNTLSGYLVDVLGVQRMYLICSALILVCAVAAVVLLRVPQSLSAEEPGHPAAA